MSVQRKILDYSQLLATTRASRAAGESLVMCHGCFDIVHPGHVRYLQFARRQGDRLLVTLTGDSHVAKGPDRPYIPEDLRAEHLAALECVDYVVVSPHSDASEILAEIRPEVYVKGREYQNSTHPGFVNEQDVVEGYGGRIIFSSGDVVFSSTQLGAWPDRREELGLQRLEWLCGRNGIDRPRLEGLLNAFTGRRVVVVGDLVLDRYVLCDATDLAAESPMMALTKLDQTEYVGGAAIVARHIAALGGQACLISAAPRKGADSVADRIRATLDAEGVEHHLLDVRDDIVTKTRFLVDDSKLFKVDEARTHPLDSRAEMQAATILARQAREADAVILCDFGYGMLSPGLLDRILPVVRRTASVITGDVSGSRASLRLLRHVDLLAPTERELRGALPAFDQGLSTAAWELLDTTQARHLFVTLGKRGLVVFDRPTQDPRHSEWSGRLRSEHLPSLAANVVDRLGCGDALLAAATLALTCGASPVQAAYLGSAAAAFEISRIGNIPVPRDALRRWIHTRPELLCNIHEPAPEPEPAPAEPEIVQPV